MKWWVCHGRRKWPKNNVRLKFLLSGPTEELAGYIPDFGFELYDLVQFSEDVNQVMADIRGIHDVEALLKIKKAIMTAKKGSEILALAKSEGI